MDKSKISLHHSLRDLEEEYGGDVTFIKSVPEDALESLESEIKWKLPEVFRYFYAHETNGMVIENKIIYSLFDKDQKKTWVNNLQRNNDPLKSPWFQGRHQIFDDYFIIGEDNGTIFCLSKKYSYPDPHIYICRNPNGLKGVDLDLLELNLEKLVVEMVRQAFA